MLAAVANPVSGRGIVRGLLPSLERIADSAGHALEVVESARPRGVGEAVLRAASLCPDAIVLFGGDGSVGEAAGAYATLRPEDRPPLVLAGGGRGNSFYRAVTDDAPWDELVERAIASLRPTPLDAARIAETGDCWALGCTLGFFHDALVAAEGIDGLSGRELYAAAGAHAATNLVPFDVEVAVDDDVIFSGRSVLTGVAGGAYRGGRLRVYPDASLTDGLLDVIVVGDVGAERFARIVAASARGEHGSIDGVTLRQGRRVAFHSTEAMRCEIDGTVHPVEGRTVTSEVLPGVLPVVIPSRG